MRAFHTPRGALDPRPLRASRCPPRHRFPLAKYALLRERVVADGLARPDEIHETEPVAWALLDARPRRARCSRASATAS